MTDITVKRIREILKDRDDSRERISRSVLEAALGVQDSQDRRRLYDALRQMVRKGELAQYDDGSYRFIIEASPPATMEEQWERVFRAVRAAKGHFDEDHISQVTVVQDYKVRAELRKLIKMGFLKEIKIDSGFFYIGTPLLSETPQVPPMPRVAKGVKTSLLQAREAVAELNRLFLTMETDLAGSRKLIKRQLDILNAEFK